MAYQIAKTSETSYAVEKGGNDYMTVSGPLEGRPPLRVGSTRKKSDIEYTMGIAALSVRYVRSKMPRGAFNNQMNIRGQYRYLTNNVSPRWLNARAETMYASLAYLGDQLRDPVTQMAARSLAALTVRGGVCSLMTYVTAGFLTTIALPGTTIVAVFDKEVNHEYVVLYFGTSPYVVADPWVGTSYVCLWDHCSFSWENVERYTQMNIKKTLGVAYGVEFTNQEVLTAWSIANIKAIDEPPSRYILDSDKQSLTEKNKYTWFHMDSAYAHPDNIQPEHIEEYDSVVGPEDWGKPVTHTQPTDTGGRRGALDWADRAATASADKFY